MPWLAQPPAPPGSHIPDPVSYAILALSLTLAAVILFRRYRSRRELIRRSSELSELAESGKAIAAVPLDPEELAEVAYQESARVLETDYFQLGVFEGDRYRTLIWVKDGERQENGDFASEPGQEGIIGWVRRNGRPLLVSDFEAERSRLPARPSYDAPDPPSSGIFVPLLAGERVIGVIAIQSRRRKAFDEHSVRLLVIIANGVASALAMANLQTQVEFRTLQLVLIKDISRRLISLQPLPDLFAQVADLISHALEYYDVRLFECTGSEVVLRAASRDGWELEGISGSRLPELVAKAVEQGETVVRTPVAEREQDAAAVDEDGLLSEMAVPLKVEGRVLGVLDIQRDTEQPFPPEHVTLAETVAAHLAIAVLEARNFASQQEEAWITTVLLEVARHAARPGDAEEALQAVLQLTTLLAGTTWAALLLPDASGEGLQLGPVSGLRRQLQEQLAGLAVPPSALGLQPPFESEAPLHITLPDSLAAPLDAQEATVVTLSDGSSLLGVLLLEGQELAGRRLPLIVGIAHQISLRLENTRLIEEAAARRSLEREIAMARDIQASFLPSHVPTHPGWEIGSTWRVARDVGGDFYDFIPLSPGPDGPRWGIVIADVADKGIPAALFMALCRTLLRSVAISRVDPGLTLERLNDLILADSKTDLFVSVFYAVWEPDAGRLSYANGGHNPPLVFERDRPARLLEEHGMVLGIREAVTYQTRSLSMPPGALLLLYTDGVTEAMDSDGQFFGIQRLENLVLGLPEWQAQHVADTIADRVSAFCAEPDLSDDLTAVVIWRAG